LRDVRNVDNQSYKRLATLEAKPTVGKIRFSRKNSKDFERKKIRELGWNQNSIPISQMNEHVHSSQRIPFDKI
jgi:hypothetical protein